MEQQGDLPNPSEKKTNLTEAFNTLLRTGKLRVPGSKKDDVEDFIKDIKVLAAFEDSMPCKGRKCLSCEGCDSLRYNLAEIREVIDTPEDEEKIPPMKAAEHAVEQNLRDVAAMMAEAAGRVDIKLSPWEIIKFMREAIKLTLNIDIFEVKKTLRKHYKTCLKEEDWTVIRTVMIINRIHWWLHDIASQKPLDKPDIFNLYLIDKANEYYLPMKLAFPDADGKPLSVKEYVDTLPNKVRNKIMTIQNHFGSQIDSTVKWTLSFRE